MFNYVLYDGKVKRVKICRFCRPDTKFLQKKNTILLKYKEVFGVGVPVTASRGNGDPRLLFFSFVCVLGASTVPSSHFPQIEAEAKPVTNQKSSGRCWLFAALNVVRLPFIKHHHLEDFEFSQGYLFFWDKIERCNFFLNNIVETTRRNEPVDGRLVSFLLQVRGSGAIIQTI